MKNGQEGLTLRVLEALFYSKKLITNNKNIKKYDFYNPNNIFIWGVDDEKNLLNFINSDYITIEENILNRYSYDSWINRFINYKL